METIRGESEQKYMQISGPIDVHSEIYIQSYYMRTLGRVATFVVTKLTFVPLETLRKELETKFHI